jgi:hypothetical protein
MKQLMIVAFILALFTNCNNSGGLTAKWSSEDRQKGLKSCIDGAEGQLDEATVKKLCNCALEKAMKKYKTYDEADAAPEEEKEQWGLSCRKTIQGGGGDDPGDEPKKVVGAGGWSKSDNQTFMNTCLKNAMNAGADREKSTTHCDCTLKKIAKKYKSYSDADRNMTKEEMNTIEQQCIAENNNNGNEGGNDNNDDN